MIVDLGSGAGHFSKLLEPENAGKVLMLDISGKPIPYFLHRRHFCSPRNLRKDFASGQ